MEKSEIQDALAHQHKMVRVLRERLQQRELQEGQYGIDTPPQVLTEIQELTERIAGHDAEIARLQTWRSRSCCRWPPPTTAPAWPTSGSAGAGSCRSARWRG